ncbi:MAG: hypothetical protein GC162_09615 [Planctomycetes bacterium]|nr:hypothetical protein [Planctomycetota bacterium]
MFRSASIAFAVSVAFAGSIARAGMGDIFSTLGDLNDPPLYDTSGWSVSSTFSTQTAFFTPDIDAHLGSIDLAALSFSTTASTINVALYESNGVATPGTLVENFGNFSALNPVVNNNGTDLLHIESAEHDLLVTSQEYVLAVSWVSGDSTGWRYSNPIVYGSRSYFRTTDSRWILQTGESASTILGAFELSSFEAVPTPAALPAGLALLGLTSFRRRR